jgi:hypothetical protein
VQHLRQEILNSQQARSDLLKWKLGLVGALGAVGLGLAGADTPGHADLVLCAVPFVSVYVDLLCRHLSLRILVIGRYFAVSGARERSEREELARYENFVEQTRSLNIKSSRSDEGNRRGADAFSLEEWAISWSSGIIATGVAVYGVGVAVSSSVPAGLALIASGVIGIVVTLLARTSYTVRQRAVRVLELPAGS